MSRLISDSDMRIWRHEFHRHPELGFDVGWTAGRVAELLGSFGCEVHTGIGGTGVVGVLQRGGSGKAIALRADMDALPIQEAEHDAILESLKKRDVQGAEDAMRFHIKKSADSLLATARSIKG